MGRKIIWDNITIDGIRVLDYVPNELVESMNSTEMKIRFKNNSILQIVGSDNFDSLVGSNPYGICFSEYSLTDERAYLYLRPILTASGGWALFLSTPRGYNHLWTLYNIAINSPQWFVTKLTVEDTKHLTLQQIEQERADGVMSEDMIQQEYYTSFSLGVEGAYYTKYIDKMRLNHQIGEVPYEIGFKVHTAWDIGVRDSTCIIFFQVIGQTIKIIDCYSNQKQGLEHYINVINQKGYIYGKHIGPHDLKVQEFGSGITRIEKARQLGIPFVVAPDVSIADGIEAVRTMFSKLWIDEVKCAPLIKALENYRQEYDIKRKIYNTHPLHDWSSHFCDSARYMAISLPKTRDGLTEQDINKMKYEAAQSNQYLPDPFRHGF